MAFPRLSTYQTDLEEWLEIRAVHSLITPSCACNGVFAESEKT